MAVLTNHRLVDQTYELIKRRIIDGEIKQGSRIEIKNLALEFNVSESPVRSAVNRLVSDGLVQVIPRRGYFAILLDEKQLEEIHDVRLLLELYAIEKCVANKRGIADFRKMYEGLQRRNTGSTERSRRRESVELDRQLHLLIINNCNNSKVQKMFLEICDLIELCQSIKDENEQQVPQEHLAILEAVLAGDAEEAKKRLVTHIENAKNRNIEALRIARQAGLK